MIIILNLMRAKRRLQQRKYAIFREKKKSARSDKEHADKKVDFLSDRTDYCACALVNL